MNQSKLAYLSGLLDADGFVGIDDGMLYEIRHCIRTGLTSRKVCRWLQTNFGGDFHKVEQKDGTVVYFWKLVGDDARVLAENLNNLPNKTIRHQYRAGLIDANGFDTPIGGDTKTLLASIRPYLIERKQQAGAILETLH